MRWTQGTRLQTWKLLRANLTRSRHKEKPVACAVGVNCTHLGHLAACNDIKILTVPTQTSMLIMPQ